MSLNPRGEYQAWPSRAQLAHFGRAESHLSLRFRQTRHAVKRFVLSSATDEGGAMSLVSGEDPDEVLFCCTDGATLRRDGN